MALLVVMYSQNVMENYSIWLKTDQETIVSNYSEFFKIAATVPLCNGKNFWLKPKWLKII